MGKDWIPTLEEYNPGITKEQWIELVQDRNVFTENALITFACIQKAKIATCADMVEEFGRGVGFYNTNNWQTGKRVYEKTQCLLSERDEGGNRFWSVCCLGRPAEKNRWEFQIRPELQDAFNETGVLEGVEVMAKKGIQGEIPMSEDLITKYTELLKKSRNLILTGVPGTGKTYLAQQIAEKMGCEKYNIGFVQFHPSYDYTDFVEGLRPKQNDNNNDIGFERKDGVFKEFCARALKNLTKPFVFIIDEINRGEVAKIFGELFFSVDPGYRITGQDLEDAKAGIKNITTIKTQYANLESDGNDFDRALGTKDYGHFFIPENVYIIGTMNDIDRSVESMDFAFRRRFTWAEIEAKNTQYMLDSPLGDRAEQAKEKMNRLNEAISTIPQLNSAYHIGASYFLKLQNFSQDNCWENLWHYHLEGILKEYLRGNPQASEELAKLKAAYEG